MSLAPRLDLRQSQQLVMTPQLQQAIKLLALSNLEVESFIAEELERNPLLDTGGGEDSAGPNEAPPAPDQAEPATLEALVSSDAPTGDTPLDVDLNSEDFHQDSAADSMGGLDGGLGLSGTGSGGAPEDGTDFDSFAGADVTLHEHLLRQAGELLSGTDLLIAERIIDLVDETGYLGGSLMDLAQRLGIALADAERVLAVVHTFDPPGVAARSLAECLALQARDADRYDPAMARLIANLDYLAKGNFSALKRICGVDEEDLADMIRELRAYDPKPGCRFESGGDRVEGVVPDVFVARRGSGWAVELNSASLPRLLVNRTYYAELAGGAQDKKSKAWLTECLADANWLMKALDQRARTIIKVSTEIVKQQEGFFRHGVASLRPLTLRTVAEAIGMHESTVSRVTSNKYLSCDRGLFELKYFFTSGIQSSDGGDAVSAETVKNRIRALISAEDAKAILSDDQLVDMLKAEGFDIARRTVAKYREAIGL
ncbi:MAG TPA: RNA polymerase factor sigma-54, partial [Allosphingosinicella sp.]